MRNNKGQFVKGYKNGFEENLKLGHGWNKGKKGWTNSGSYTKGHKLSTESIKKLSSSLVERTSPRKGVHLSEEIKKKLRIALKGKNNGLVGEKHSNWKGGITPLRKKLYFSREYQKWRKAVFIRDNYTCQICRQKGGELNADHIKQWAFYPELRFDIDNGRTLCIDCHRQTDTWGVKSAKTSTTYDGFIVGQSI